MQVFGIDVSRWQGNFDFEYARNEDGIEFAIVKAGGADDGMYTDSKYERNYAECKRLGIPVGCYFFGQAFSEEEARTEAEYFVQLLDGKQLEYPVFYDVEAEMLNQDYDTLTNIIRTFCDAVGSNGYWVGLYSSEAQFNSSFDSAGVLGDLTHWVAKYSKSSPKINTDVNIWQFGGDDNFIRSTQIAGQTCDQNYCYTDYPSRIKAAGLNGFIASVSESEEIEESEGKMDRKTAENYVKTTYLEILHREADPSGLDAYASKLQSDGDYDYVDTDLMNSEEYRNIQNEQNVQNAKDFVARCYRTYLHREASEDEINSWVNSGLRFRDINSGIENSEEALNIVK